MPLDSVGGSQALTTGYLATPITIPNGCTALFVKLDDETIAFTVKINLGGLVDYEEPMLAGQQYTHGLKDGRIHGTGTLDVKAASGTPSAIYLIHSED